jgi:zinc transporter, ZIP family
MEAGEAVTGRRDSVGSRRRWARLPSWVLALVPLALIAALIGALALAGSPGLGERVGPPVEELAVERTVLRPGEIELLLRNDGPDAVRVAQVMVNDAFSDFDLDQDKIGRLGAAKLRIPYPWVEGEAYEVTMLTSTGATIGHQIDVAAETPAQDSGFFGLMALLGLYVGVIPVALGMLWLPWMRRLGRRWIALLMAVTVGLLAFLAVDAGLEALEVAERGAAAFGGPLLVFAGAALGYLALAAVDGLLRRRGETKGGRGPQLALFIAIGIGLHNLGEGLAIGTAYAVGALALGAFLVIGFAIHNTTEGLAIVAPLSQRRPSLGRLALLGLIAGAPAILGAWLGATAVNPSLAALLLGLGVGAIAQVVVQLVPSMRDRAGRALHPTAVAGMLAGGAILYATSLLVAV